MGDSVRRIHVPLNGQEQIALSQLAGHLKRDPRDQAAFMIREALEARGLLKGGDFTYPEKKDKEIRRQKKEIEELQEKIKAADEEIKSLRYFQSESALQVYSKNMQKLFYSFMDELSSLANEFNDLREKQGLEKIDFTSRIEQKIKENYPTALGELDNG